MWGGKLGSDGRNGKVGMKREEGSRVEKGKGRGEGKSHTFDFCELESSDTINYLPTIIPLIIYSSSSHTSSFLCLNLDG